MMKDEILLIDDDISTHVLIEHCLSDKFALIKTTNLESAKEKLRTKRPKMIILDLNLPDGSGFDFLKYLAEEFSNLSIPVLLLSVDSHIDSKVKGFSFGIYDYIVKPFSIIEFKTRVDAHLTRAKKSKIFSDEELRVNRFLINNANRSIFVEDKKLELTPLEFKLLSYFILNSNKVVDRDEIAKTVWNKPFYQSRTIDKHVSTLRKKLGSASVSIETVSQLGYLLKN